MLIIIFLNKKVYWLKIGTSTIKCTQILKKNPENPDKFYKLENIKGETTKVFIDLFCPNLVKTWEMMMP